MTMGDLERAVAAHYAQFGRTRRPLYLVQQAETITAVAVDWNNELVELGSWPIGTRGGSGVVRLSPHLLGDLPHDAVIDLTRGLAYQTSDPFRPETRVWLRLSGVEVLP